MLRRDNTARTYPEGRPINQGWHTPPAPRPLKTPPPSISATSSPRTETVAAYRADEGKPAASRYLGVGIGAIGVHTSGASPLGSSARHPTVRAGSHRREVTSACLEEVSALEPTPKGRPIKAT